MSLGFCQLHLILIYQAGWCWMKTLGLLLDDLGLHKVFGSSHDAGLEMDATSSEPFIMGS